MTRMASGVAASTLTPNAGICSFGPAVFLLQHKDTASRSQLHIYAGSRATWMWGTQPSS